jgi:TP901 family phage tail tape measure protein
MANSIIGQLRVILGLDTAAFEKGLDDSQRQLVRHGRQMERWGERVAGVGRSLSVGLTLPLLAIGGTALGMASKFESAMNRVEAATGAGAAELKAMRDQAIAFGRDKRFPATAADTADAMENLAKNGRSVADILGGATEATLMLAAATGGPLPEAADLATDLMAQFGKTAAELPSLVNKISGAMVASKLDFDNYRLAVGQAGSVAGNVMPFEEFNTAIAATAAGFASGSDAGTSFKTFVQRLVPQSKEAAEMMKLLGLEFFDADGKFIGVAASAELLRVKLGGLNQEAQQNALTTIFGSDSSRTAIELMKQGADGIARVGAEIDKISAKTQAEALMKGWAGALAQTKKAFESAAIAMGDSGFLSGITAVLTAVAACIEGFSHLPSPILLTIGAVLGLTAAVGPMVFITGKAVSMWGGLVVLLSSRLAPALAATAAATASTGAAATGAAARFGALRGAMAFLGGPWAITIGLISGAIWGISLAADSVGPATRTAREELARLRNEASGTGQAADTLSKGVNEATDAMETAIARAQRLTSELYGVKAGALAAAVELSRMNVAAATKQLRDVRAKDDRPLLARWMGVQKGASRYHQASVRGAMENVSTELAEYNHAKAALDAAIAAAKAPPGAPKRQPGATGSLPAANDNKKRTGAGASGPTPEELAAKREDIRLQAQLDAAQERGDIGAAQRLQDQIALKRQIADYEDAGLSKAEAKKSAESDMAAIADARRISAAREIIDQQRSVDLDIARLTGDEQRAAVLEREQEIKDRILFFEQQLVGVTDEKLRLEQATALAMKQQADVDAARARMRAKWLADDALQREIDLMKLRGDGEDRIRLKERELEIQRRIAELVANAGMTEAAARAVATAEDEASEMARRQGQWRDTIKGGLRAALDGDLKGFAENWWKDQIARGMESALNKVSDLLFSLFEQAFSKGASALGGGGESGGGLFGAIGSLLGNVLGGTPIGGGGASKIGNPLKVPGFKTGGSFNVGGMAGIDRNMVQFRATKGENVTITKPGQERGAGNVINMNNDFRGADPGAVSAIKAKLDMLDRSLETRSIVAVADAQERRIIGR